MASIDVMLGIWLPVHGSFNYIKSYDCSGSWMCHSHTERRLHQRHVGATMWLETYMAQAEERPLGTCVLLLCSSLWSRHYSLFFLIPKK